MVQCSGVLVRSRSRYLLCHATGGDSFSWSIPKGCLEPNETFAEAAMRELTEETGLSVQIDPLQQPFFVFRVGKAKVVRVFLVELDTIDETALHCSSLIDGSHPLAGQPEMDGFVMASWKEGSFVDLFSFFSSHFFCAKHVLLCSRAKKACLTGRSRRSIEKQNTQSCYCAARLRESTESIGEEKIESQRKTPRKSEGGTRVLETVAL